MQINPQCRLFSVILMYLMVLMMKYKQLNLNVIILCWASNSCVRPQLTTICQFHNAIWQHQSRVNFSAWLLPTHNTEVLIRLLSMDGIIMIVVIKNDFARNRL